MPQEMGQEHKPLSWMLSLARLPHLGLCRQFNKMEDRSKAQMSELRSLGRAASNDKD